MREGAQPPGALLIDLTKVAADDLLGDKAKRAGASPKTARLFKCLRRSEERPATDAAVTK